MAIQEPDTCKHKLFENIHVVFLKKKPHESGKNFLKIGL